MPLIWVSDSKPAEQTEPAKSDMTRQDGTADGCRDEAAKIVLVLLAGAAMVAALVGAVVKAIA